MGVSYVGMCMLSHTYTAPKVLNYPAAGDDRQLWAANMSVGKQTQIFWRVACYLSAEPSL